jgi:spore germination protein GerM
LSPRRDPYFGRFAFLVSTVAVVIIVLGLVFIWYFFQAGGSSSPTNPLRGLVNRGGNLPPNQVLLYYTKDGKQLVPTVADIGTAGMSANDKARLVITKLLEGKDAAFLKSPIPPGTKLNSVFINGNIVIVNLSKEYMANLRGGVDAELLAIYSIVNSVLYNIETADAVQILVEGEKVLTLGGSIDIESPLIANSAITRAS